MVGITDYSSRGPTSQFTAVLASVPGDSTPSHRYKGKNNNNSHKKIKKEEGDPRGEKNKQWSKLIHF